MPRGDKTPPVPAPNPAAPPGNYTCKMVKVFGYNILLVEITSGPYKGERHLARTPNIYLELGKDRADLKLGPKPYAQRKDHSAA